MTGHPNKPYYAVFITKVLQVANLKSSLDNLSTERKELRSKERIVDGNRSELINLVRNSQLLFKAIGLITIRLFDMNLKLILNFHVLTVE